MKPANILVDGQGEPHVTDFGLARRIDTGSDLTHSGYPVGTPSYMSPEQARGDKGSLTTATDVYGLGSILYALLTGNAPFVGSSLAETLDKVRAAAPEPPTRLNARVPRDLEIICLKCLEKDPQRRYASARLLADDLNRWLGGKPIEARPVGTATRAWMWCRRNPLPAGLAALCALAIVVGLAGITWKWREADVARDLAETTNAFLLNKLFDQASPRFNPRGASLTVGELLDRASSRLKSEFEGRPEVEAAIRRTLGSAYQFLSRYDQATLHYEEAIKLDSQLHGPHHRQTLRDVNLLTSSLDDAARYAEAEPLALPEPRGLQELAGPARRDHPRRGVPVRRGAFSSRQARRGREPAAGLRAGSAPGSGAQHPDTLRSINLLGLLLQDRGKLDEADELALEYEHGIRCLFGTKHPDNVTALAGRGRVRLNQGRLDEAELLYEAAAAESSRILGADHPRTLAALDDHARVLQKNGKTHDAQRVLREAWELARSGRGLDDPETLKAGCRHARALIDGGNAQEGRRVLGLILPRCKTVLGPDHPVTREANRAGLPCCGGHAARVGDPSRPVRSPSLIRPPAALHVPGKSDARELPPGLRGKEVAVGGPDVRPGRCARATPQDHLVAHELAVVLAQRPRGRAKAPIGRVRALGPFPDVAEELPGCRVRGAPGAGRRAVRDETVPPPGSLPR